MQGISLFVVLAIAVSAYAYNINNGGNLAVNGGSAAGVSTDDDVSYLYAVYVPANTLVFNFTLTSTAAPGTSSSCYYYASVKNYGFPCDSVSFDESGFYFCKGYDQVGYVSEGSPSTYSFSAGYAVTAAGSSDYQRVHLPSNNYFFIQIWAYSSASCAFTITTSASNCSTLAGGVGQIGAAYSSFSDADSDNLGTEYCIAPTSVPNTGSTFVVANATGPIVYNLTLPLNTAYVNVTYTFAVRDNNLYSGTNFYVYANADHAGADNYISSCYESASSNYTESFTCTFVPAGPFFVQVFPSLSSTNPANINYFGNITITPKICSAGTLGPNCQPISFDPSPLIAGTPVNQTVPASSEYFIYIDVPSAVIGTNFTIYYQGSASLYVSRSFVSAYLYSGYTSYGYISLGSQSSPYPLVHLAQFDLNNNFGGFDTSDAASLKLAGVPLRFYMSFYCSGSTPCPISLSAAAQQTMTTGATGVSTASTAAVSTASTASASTASASTASTASASTNSASTASASTTRGTTASASTTRGTTASVSTTTGAASSLVASFAVIVAIIA